MAATAVNTFGRPAAGPARGDGVQADGPAAAGVPVRGPEWATDMPELTTLDEGPGKSR
jgi:hypothetical protein